MERLVQFTFLGQKYKVYTGTSEEDMEKILALIHQVEDETLSECGEMLPASKVAVMVSLNIASQYLRLQKEFDQFRTEMETRIGSLNEQIDTDLFQENSRHTR